MLQLGCPCSQPLLPTRGQSLISESGSVRAVGPRSRFPDRTKVLFLGVQPERPSHTALHLTSLKPITLHRLDHSSPTYTYRSTPSFEQGTQITVHSAHTDLFSSSANPLLIRDVNRSGQPNGSTHPADTTNSPVPQGPPKIRWSPNLTYSSVLIDHH